jgi:hypothetical protein
MRSTKFAYVCWGAMTLVMAGALTACGGGSNSTNSASLTAQTITFNPASTGTVGTPITLVATSTSSLTVTFTSSTTSVCTVSGTTLSLLTAGTCTVKADQAGNATYTAATQVTKNITVSAAPATPSTTIATFSETGASMVGFGAGTAASIITDPADSANKVVQVIKTTAGETWAGATFNTCGAGALGTVPTLPLSASNKTMSLRVKSPTAGVKIRLKLEDNADVTHTVETDATVTAANTWQTLTFDFSNPGTGTAALNTSYTFNKASVFPNFGAQETGSDKTYLFDDLVFIGSSSVSLSCPAAPVSGVPTTAAPTPTKAAADVVSIYSDAYTGPTVIDTNPGWGQSTETTTTPVAGNNTQKYTKFNYQGIDFASNPVNVSASTNLHIDLWSSDATAVDVFIISGSPTIEQSYKVTLTASAWTSVDIPMTSYTTPNKNAIIQIKLVSTPFGGTTVYMDNLYFWK